MDGIHNWSRGSLLGLGSFGEVNLAINNDTGELFAVKSVAFSDRSRAEQTAIENELAILQTLDSPHVVKCLGGSVTRGEDGAPTRRNLFMEWVAGGSLADLTKKFGAPLEEKVIRRYARDMVEGLRYVHGKGVVHCDLKGKNVLIGSMGAKLADFGSAKRVPMPDQSSGYSDGEKAAMATASSSLSSLCSIKGTPLWMAPEVVQQIEQGFPADVWSLGCTVLEMATGKPPWSDRFCSSSSPNVITNAMSAMYRIASCNETPPLPPFLSPLARDFLSCCLRRNPSSRWSCTQLLRHPFLAINSSSSNSPSSSDSSAIKVPLSPTSVIELRDWDSSSSASGENSVPVLDLAMRLDCCPSAVEENSAEAVADCRETQNDAEILQPEGSCRSVGGMSGIDFMARKLSKAVDHHRQGAPNGAKILQSEDFHLSISTSGVDSMADELLEPIDHQQKALKDAELLRSEDSCRSVSASGVDFMARKLSEATDHCQQQEARNDAEILQSEGFRQSVSTLSIDSVAADGGELLSELARNHQQEEEPENTKALRLRDFRRCISSSGIDSMANKLSGATDHHPRRCHHQQEARKDPKALRPEEFRRSLSSNCMAARQSSGGWITVRSSSSSNLNHDWRQADKNSTTPLLPGGEEGALPSMVRKGSEVNLDCLLLLRNRARGGRAKASPS